MGEKKRGFFITFDGVDGCGKTTQARLLAADLQAAGFPVLHTREPGGNHLAEEIRRILLDTRHKISPRAELFLYQAARSEHTEEVIKPALAAGKIVICERYTDATIAYQGFGRGLPLKIIEQLNSIATQNIKPDLTIFLDLRPETGLARRMALTGKKTDRLENENISFHQQVRQGYLHLAKKERRRIKTFSALASPEKIQDLIQKYVRKKLNRNQ